MVFNRVNGKCQIKDIGTMYLQFNQAGGSIASEEAEGRNILIPNAMLFDEVVIIKYRSKNG